MNIIYSQNFSQFPINHGFSTKSYTDSGQIIFPKQNHTNNVTIDDDSVQEADAIITLKKNKKIGIKTADCVPILVYEKNKRIVAAVHAGWRGTANKILENVILKIIEMGGHVENMYAGIGPAIGECCYDVSQERASYFGRKFLTQRNNKTFLNLKNVNMQQLLDMNIPQENIELAYWCTSCNNDMFFSYRKEKPLIKQNISFIEIN